MSAEPSVVPRWVVWIFRATNDRPIVWDACNFALAAGLAAGTWFYPSGSTHWQMGFFAFYCWVANLNLDEIIRKTSPELIEKIRNE